MHEKIGHIINKTEIQSIDANLTAIECAKLMSSLNIGALVVKENDKLVGLISERDITRYLAMAGPDISNILAKDLVFEEVAYLDINDLIETAMQTINDMRRRHVLIKQDDKVVGILSIGDIMKHLIEDKNHTISQLEKYIHG